MASAERSRSDDTRLAGCQSPNVLAIPGTGNPAHLEENIAAGALPLTPQELATLA